MRSPRKPSKDRVALILPSVMASGTERRMAFVYRHLNNRFPATYLLVLSADLYRILNRAGFGLDRLPDVHVLGPRSRFDVKRGAHASPWVNLGRILTLFGYRQELARLIEQEGIGLVHSYLEMVPFLGLAPLRQVPSVVAVIDHLPKYYDLRTLDCRLLLRAIRTASRVDCLYPWISERVRALGVEPHLLNNPAWNCVNHEAFRPEEKDERAISFAARAIDWKNPILMLDVIHHVLRHRPDAHFSILGTGRLQADIALKVADRGWAANVRAGYLEDPSPIVNRSLIHISLDRFDNAPNQSLLEGMAAGCAIVASHVGETEHVVTEDVGLLTPLEAEPVAEAILHLLEDPKRTMRMGQAGRRRVLENHHVDRYIDYLRLVHDLTNPGPVVDGVRRPVEGLGEVPSSASGPASSP